MQTSHYTSIRPACNSSIEDAEDFHQSLSDSTEGQKNLYQIVLGDFNAKKAKKESTQEQCIGRFGLGTRNERGQMLIDYASRKNMKIGNTVSYKKAQHKWTRRSPNGEMFNEIDFILTSNVTLDDVDVLNRIN